jgi:hypothetical protein
VAILVHQQLPGDVRGGTELVVIASGATRHQPDVALIRAYGASPLERGTE